MDYRSHKMSNDGLDHLLIPRDEIDLAYCARQGCTARTHIMFEHIPMCYWHFNAMK